MMSLHSISQAKIQGSLAAARALSRLGVDLTSQIDIFGAITQAPLWLLFQPLQDLLGVYLPDGILINAYRSKALQRLTAAHEYGHYVMNHEPSIDNEGNIIQIPENIRNLQDVAAQAFAMDFLMPPQLINSLYQRLEVPTSIEPLHAYQLSLYLGTSYEATIYRLIAMEKISGAMGQHLLRTKPKQIKRDIGFGVGPNNPWADMWPINVDDMARPFHLRPDDELELHLPESPSTGYLWSILDCPDLGSLEGKATTEVPDAPIGLVTSTYQPLSGEVAFGNTGVRHFRLRALQPGRLRLRVILHRPWQGNTDILDIHEMNISIEIIPLGLPPVMQERLQAA